MSSAPLILASASPRRRELLARLVPRFEVRAGSLEEPCNRPAGVSPAGWAEALAHFKTRSVADSCPDSRVLGADTLVDCGGQVLGKPQDRAAAERMLRLQGGRETLVITGLCLLERAGALPRRRAITHVVTRVWMRDDAERRERYLDSGDWQGKAGAYGIQSVGDELIERIEGSFTNVVGLPLERLAQLLQVG